MDFIISLPAYFIVFALGAAVGSFLNVVAYRLPAGLSVLHPPSRCPHCHTQLSPSENLPVLGWLWLRGRCKHCQTPISIRYPMIEAITGGLFLLVFCQFTNGIEIWGYWVFLSGLLALSLIDLDTLTLPNPLTQSGLLAGLGFQLLQGSQFPLNSGEISRHLMLGILGAVVGLWLLDAIAFLGSISLGQTAMGAGDSKLAAMIGAWLGWKLLLLAGFLACAAGAIVGGGAIALGGLNRRQKIPFGPFLALGAILTLFWGERILSAYLSLFFPTII